MALKVKNENLNRFIEYISVIGISNEDYNDIIQNCVKYKDKKLEGKILQRFPQEDHLDFPFPSGLSTVIL